MKTLKQVSIFIIALLFMQTTFAQTQIKTATVAVNGVCGSCKKHIEKSAMDAGATTAVWDKKTKFLQISYDPSKSNTDKIEQSIAKSGYDTQDYKATEADYKNLDECCQYQRKDLIAPKKD